MAFYETLSQILALLQRDKRVSYRALKRQFALDDEFLEDIKAEIIQAKKLAVDEDGAVLVWSGGSTTPGTPGLDPEGTPLAYTPLYLTEKILASRSTLEGERKQITVLFADLKGSTDLIAGLDPEEARQLLDPALQAIMKDYQVVEWRFKNGSVRAAQSLRIPYYFTDEYGQTVKDYVLIGFEGAGGE